MDALSDMDTPGPPLTTQLRALETEFLYPKASLPFEDALGKERGGDVPTWLGVPHNRRRFDATFSSYRSRDLEDLAIKMSRNGATVVFAPNEAGIAEEGFAMGLRAADFVVPICHEGMNRSQVAHLVLHGLKRMAAGAACPPKRRGVALAHGAESGFDPYQAHKDIDGESFFGYIHGAILPKEKDSEWLHRNFFAVFGVDKSRRVGQVFCERRGLELNPDLMMASGPSPLDLPDPFQQLSIDRRLQRAHMDGHLYSYAWLKSNTLRPDGRIVLLCYVRAAPIVMRRMLENTVNRDFKFKGLVIVALPLPDNISSAGGRDEIAAELARGNLKADRHSLNQARHRETYGFYSTYLRLHPDDVDGGTLTHLLAASPPVLDAAASPDAKDSDPPPQAYGEDPAAVGVDMDPRLPAVAPPLAQAGAGDPTNTVFD